MRATSPRTRRRKPEHDGISAIDVLIGMSVLALVVLLAVPGSSLLIEQYRLRSASSQLVNDIYLARSEAQNRASTVRVCPSDDGRHCRTDGDWNHGWLVFSDGNGDGLVQDIELLEAFQAPGGHVRILASGAAQTTAAFTSTGLVRENGSAIGEFILCPDKSSSSSRIIAVDADGWVSVEKSDERVCQNG